MRTMTVNVELFSIDELSSKAQEYTISKFRENIDMSYAYNEAHNTVKEFNELFVLHEGRNSWLELNTRGSINDSEYILDLKGMRLRTYIINNFGHGLVKPKYIGHIQKDVEYKHPRVRSKKLSNGRVFNPYYSGCQTTDCCVLTGVCYDDDILRPIYDFLNWKNPSVCNEMLFIPLLKSCYDSLRKSLEAEEEERTSDECIKEELQGVEFLKTGQLFNGI